MQRSRFRRFRKKNDGRNLTKNPRKPQKQAKVHIRYIIRSPKNDIFPLEAL
jgi:hypothetical protein